MVTTYTPILHMPQVSSAQNQKELTINTALAILEAAGNDTLAVSMASGNVALTQDQFTKYMMFRLSGHSGVRSLFVPDSKRFFVVSNEGTGAVSVVANGSASGSVTVPIGKIVLISGDGDTVRAVSSGVGLLTDLGDVDLQDSHVPLNGDVLTYDGVNWVPHPSTTSTFVGLADTPANYTSAALKLVRVNAGHTALEFVAATTALLTDFPTYSVATAGFLLRTKLDGSGLEFTSVGGVGLPAMSNLADVDLGTGLGSGDTIVYDGAVWEPRQYKDTFLKLIDTPSSFSGQASKGVRVNAGATALEFYTIVAGVTALDQLSDVELSTGPVDGHILRYRGGVWQDESLNFQDLANVPVLAGNGNKYARVRADGAAIEFVSLAIPYLLGQLADVEMATGVTDGDILRYRDNIWQAEPFPTSTGGSGSTSFIGLTDVPGSYSGANGKVVRVNAGATGLEFVTLFIPTSLDMLSDVELSTGPVDGHVLRYRNSQWQDESFNFQDLANVPGLAGNGGKYARVRADGLALEFITAPFVSRLDQLSDVELSTGPVDGHVLRYRDSQWQDEAFSFISLSDAPTTYGSNAGKGLRVNSGGNGVEFKNNIESLVIAVSDETTAITTGTAKVTFRMPYAFTLTAVRASLTAASSSGIPTVDIKETGTTILSTLLTIDASEKTSTTAATPVVISDTSLADDAEITVDITVAGTNAAGLKIYLIGFRT